MIPLDRCDDSSHFFINMNFKESQMGPIGLRAYQKFMPHGCNLKLDLKETAFGCE